MRLRVPVLLIALLLPLGPLAGCSGDDPDPGSGPGLPSQADLKAYFEAITSADPDEIATARSDVAADGSLAQGYAAYVDEVGAAAAAAGQPGDPTDVEEVDGGFKACVGSDQCVTWADLEGKGGRLTDFTVNGTRLDDLLVDLTAQAPVKAPGLYEVQPDWAYRLPLSGTLNVVATIAASDAPISPRVGTYIEQDQILKGTQARSPATIEAGTSSPVVLAFPDATDAKLDGQVTFDLDIQGVGVESIGFGLTDPAA